MVSGQLVFGPGNCLLPKREVRGARHRFRVPTDAVWLVSVKKL